MCLVRGCRPGKTVQMTEAEVRALCLKSREIFLSQPILLELEAPLKICGEQSHMPVVMFNFFKISTHEQIVFNFYCRVLYARISLLRELHFFS